MHITYSIHFPMASGNNRNVLIQQCLIKNKAGGGRRNENLSQNIWF